MVDHVHTVNSAVTDFSSDPQQLVGSKDGPRHSQKRQGKKTNKQQNPTVLTKFTAFDPPVTPLLLHQGPHQDDLPTPTVAPRPARLPPLPGVNHICTSADWTPPERRRRLPSRSLAAAVWSWAAPGVGAGGCVQWCCVVPLHQRMRSITPGAAEGTAGDGATPFDF